MKNLASLQDKKVGESTRKITLTYYYYQLMQTSGMMYHGELNKKKHFHYKIYINLVDLRRLIEAGACTQTIKIPKKHFVYHCQIKDCTSRLFFLCVKNTFSFQWECQRQKTIILFKKKANTITITTYSLRTTYEGFLPMVGVVNKPSHRPYSSFV